MAEFIPTFIFFGCILAVIFWVIYVKNTLDAKWQKKLHDLFQKKHSANFTKIEKDPRYLKKLGTGIYQNRQFTIFTNNNEATLNRQIIFEIELNAKETQPFTILRNANARPKKFEENQIQSLFRIYRVPFSTFYQLGSKIQIASETLKTPNAEDVWSILHKSTIQEKFLKIPLFLKVLGLNAINTHWKIYFEKKFLGVELQSSFVKTMNLEMIEDFLDLLSEIASELEVKI